MPSRDEYERWLEVQVRELRRVIDEAVARDLDLDILVVAVEVPETDFPKMYSLKNFGEPEREIEILLMRMERAAAQHLGIDPSHLRTVINAETGERRGG